MSFFKTLTSLSTSAVIFALLSPLPSLASVKKLGPSTGGGGQGVLCKTSGQNPSLQTLDLYEAQNVWGYQIPPGGDLASEIKRVYPNFARQRHNRPPFNVPPVATPRDLERLGLEHADFVSRMRAIPAGSRLALSNDSGVRILQPPKNCEIVQIAYYADDDDYSGSILIDQEYWNLLDPQNQLALSTHESQYKWLRRYGEKSSTQTRKLVGLLFNSKEYPGPLSSLYGQPDSLYCFVETANSDISVSFWVLPMTGTPGLDSKLVFDSIQDSEQAPTLVDTTAYSMWTYDEWKANDVKTSAHIVRTSSVLGSRTVRMYPTDPNCPLNGKNCTMSFDIRLDDGKWTGGPIVCRERRDAHVIN